MFREIVQQIPWPIWADARYRRLAVLDLLLDGKLYDHLSVPFTKETRGRFKIPLWQRRPCTTYNLIHEAASKIARRLFASDNAPEFRGSEAAVRAAQALRRAGSLDLRMLQAAYWGSVGSVAVTFSFVPTRTGTVAPCYDVWRARWCDPIFDAAGQLASLVVRYVVPGIRLAQTGPYQDADGEAIVPDYEYWYVREFTTEQVRTYWPVRNALWSPQMGLAALRVIPEEPWTISHPYGVVPGHWMVNLSVGEWPDGGSTWAQAIDDQIDIDYTLSQLGRALRYNASPQIVIKGRLANVDEDEQGNVIVRSPSMVLQLEADQKSASGEALTGHDAKLLEMRGTWVGACLDYVERIRQHALEMIGLSSKDPNKVGGIMSGKAMELLETAETDLLQELRTAYGDGGLLPIMRRTLRAAAASGLPVAAGLSEAEVDALDLVWPRPFRATANELVQYVTAFKEAVEAGFLTAEEAAHMLHLEMDLPMPDRPIPALGAPRVIVPA